MANSAPSDRRHIDSLYIGEVQYIGVFDAQIIGGRLNANLNLSDRVRRGPDWKWGCQDIMGPATWSNLSGATWAQSHISTLCLRVLRRVGVRVKWDQGGSSRYRTEKALEKAGGADLVKATVRNPAGCHPSGHVVRRKGSPEPRSLRGRRGVSVRQLQYCVLFTFKRRAPVTAPRGTRLARYISTALTLSFFCHEEPPASIA